jgi:DNA-binding NarL/FixJ family response regulator
MKTTILLADDHQLVRDGLKALLDAEDDLEVVGEADDGRSALTLVREIAPDVVVMDIAMSGLNGIEATRQIRNEMPATKVIALSMHSNRRYVLGMLRAGAWGYVLKAGAYEDLVDAVRTVRNERIFTSPGIKDMVLEEYVRGGTSKEPASPLSAREREVLQLLAEGKTSKEIASILNVSVNTVDTHKRRIMQKLQLRTTAELTKYALREGLTTLDD